MSNSAEQLLDGRVRVTEDAPHIPDWLRRLDRESRIRQRRVIVQIEDDDDTPELPSGKDPDSRH